MAFPLIFENLTRGFDSAVRVFSAMGHGRSYGQWSRFFWRGLPGIVDCGLWEALNGIEDEPAARSLLVTDVGNDLAYGVSVDQILNWVETCVERVGAESSNTTLTLPPVDTLRRISAWRFRIMRTVTFPGCRIPLDAMIDSAVELAERMESLGQALGARVVSPSVDWFGFDPIHIRRGCRSDAWRSILGDWPGFDSACWLARVTRSRRIRRRDRIPAQRTLFGRVLQLTPSVVADAEATLSAF